MPGNGAGRGFFDVSGSYTTEGTWTTIDINGDSKPDLVFPSRYGQNVWGGDAAAYWKVYLASP